jgi:two-component system chemotaxis sensor kinase CheA
VSQFTGQPPTATRVAHAEVVPEPTVATGAPAPPPPSAAAPAEREAGLGLPPRFGLKVRIAQTCPVPGVRAFLVHKRLSGLGNIFDLKPPLEDLKAGRIPEGLISLELETGSGEAAIAQALKNISEVEVVSVRPIDLNAQPPAPPPKAPVVPAVEAPKVVGQEPARTVRVRTELLDYFLDTVGELLLATSRIREVSKALPEASQPLLDESVDRLHGLVKDLHDKVMTARMTPIAIVTDRLPRVARDIARRREREVDMVITGAEIELDRAILDELTDPLLHILRNCIDHGLESPEERAAARKGIRGRVLVSVRRDRDRVVLEIEDDGRGMDAEKLKSSAVARGLITAEAASRMPDKEAFMLCCLPGVSTAKNVSEISGRGVGMDAVKRAVENVNGTMEIESEKGRGTRFTLRLPLTVAVVNLLLVEVGQEVVGVPTSKVLGAVELDPSKLSHSRETALLPHGNTLLPVHQLSELLQVPPGEIEGTRPFLVMEADAGRVALAVDRLLGQEEVVLKALSRPLDLVAGLSGVTILGTGRPVFILDVPRLLAA